MKVAVVIPTFNRAAMAAEAVASALLQTHDVRVVVVDDGSTDGTSELLFARFGSDIEVVRQENSERGAARNAGAALAADAELLCFLDADDVLYPHHVATLVDAAREHPTASLVAARAVATDAELQPLRMITPQRRGLITLRDFLHARAVLPPSAMGIRGGAFRALGGFPVDRRLSGSEDWYLTVRLLAGEAGVQADAETVLLRKHPGNTMADSAAMERSMLLAHEELFRLHRAEVAAAVERDDLPRDLESRARAVLLVHAAASFYGAGDMRRARALLRQARGEWPGVVLSDPRVPWVWVRSWLGAGLTRRLRGWKRGGDAR